MVVVGWPVVIIEAQDARDAVTEAAFTTEEGRTILHSFAHTSFIALGADVDLEVVLDAIDNAEEIAWCTHPLEHDLCIVGDVDRFYSVPRPERKT